MSPPLTADRVRTLLDYDPNTGIMTWRVRQSIRVQIGHEMKGKMVQGHLRVSIDYKRYLVHRVAWLHYYGKWPDHRLDHKNCNAADNRIENLRECSHSQNLHNRAAQKNNQSGLKGVSFDKRRKRWFARIKINGDKQQWLGSFATAEEAHAAYAGASALLVGEFSRMKK